MLVFGAIHVCFVCGMCFLLLLNASPVIYLCPMQAEQRCQVAEQEILQRKARVAALRVEAEELTKANRAVKHQFLTASTFQSAALLAKYQQSE